jgi:hypothetical protein
MKIRRRSPSPDGMAVFSRNFDKYLDAAARARGPVTFRGEKRWVTAAHALKRAESIPIYFAVVDGPPQVRYTATLREVLVDPRRAASDTKRLLAHSLAATAKEGLWETAKRRGPVRTLYLISDCIRLNRPFPIARLMKARDGTPLSAGYRYSYALVRPVKPL